MKTALITGTTGLIGSHLRRLAPLDYEVVSITREQLEKNDIPPADVIIHAAGYAQPAKFVADFQGTVRVNTETTARLLEHLHPYGKFLFCSSTEVYSGLTRAASEHEIGTTTPQHPRAAYIESKRCGEAIVQGYRNRGINAMSARISFAYGPGVKAGDTRVISQFIDQALSTGKIIMKDYGEAVRTPCYVEDTAEMLWTIIQWGTYGVYNVSGRQATTIANIARLIAYHTGAHLCFPEDAEGFVGVSGSPDTVKVDIRRYESEFGLVDFTSLEEGLRYTVDWHRRFHS